MTAPIVHRDTREPSYREMWSESPEDGDQRSHRLVASETPELVRERVARMTPAGTLWEREADRDAAANTLTADQLVRFVSGYHKGLRGWITAAWHKGQGSPIVHVEGIGACYASRDSFEAVSA